MRCALHLQQTRLVNNPHTPELFLKTGEAHVVGLIFVNEDNQELSAFLPVPCSIEYLFCLF